MMQPQDLAHFFVIFPVLALTFLTTIDSYVTTAALLRCRLTTTAADRQLLRSLQLLRAAETAIASFRRVLIGQCFLSPW